MMEAERKTKQVSLEQVKAIEGGSGGFSGYASVFGIEDSYGEATAPGCFQKWLSAFVDEGWIAEGHDWRKLGCGYIAKAYEDAHGLYIEIQFHSDTDSQAIRTKINERIAASKKVKLSIGYYLRAYEVIVKADKGTVIKLTEVELKEVSIVNVPANPAADVLSAKSAEDLMEQFRAMPFETQAKFLVASHTAFKHRVEDRIEGRTDRKAGAELSQQNVALIDATIEAGKAAVESIMTSNNALQELADRNRKGAESTPSPSPGTSEKSDAEPSTDELFRDFHKRNIEYLSHTAKAA